MSLSIEIVPESEQRTCPDCGRPFRSVRGFVYEDGDAYAVYHAMLQTGHPSTVVEFALSLGDRSEKATGADRTRIGIRVWPLDDKLHMHINNPSESAWGDSETFGQMADRRDVLDTPLEEDALRTIEFVIDHDRRIAEHLL